MANQLPQRTVVRWLRDHGFKELPRGPTGHLYFTNGAVKVTLNAHGPKEVNRGQMHSIVREIARAGFDRKQVIAELLSGEWKAP